MISFNIVALVVLQITAQASEKKNVQKDLIFNFTELLEKVNSFLWISSAQEKNAINFFS